MNPESIKQRLKNITKDSGQSLMELFKQLTFERFLARVSVSKYRENLIFKGGLCLRHYVKTDRGTKDLDFLLKQLDAHEDTIKEVFTEVSGLDLNDGFEFSDVSITSLEDGNKQYPGFRIKIKVLFGKMSDSLQIDIGIGDSVDEFELEFERIKYKDQPLIGKGGISLLAYPPEFIFSEKLQAIISLGAFNSRMKDYFDCFLLVTQEVMDKENTKKAIGRTFEKRNTEIQLIEDFSAELSSIWSDFTKKLDEAPETISEVIEKINKYLKSLDLV